jgi:hypothetical protein
MPFRLSALGIGRCLGIAGWVTGLLLVPGGAMAATIHIHPGGSFEAAAESLNPGDTLVVHAGTYAQSARVAITVKGTPTAPVVITGAPGEARPLISRVQTASVQNTIDIVGATHLTLRGLEITGQVGGDGINMSGSPSHILLEDLDIHDVAVGINFRSTMHHITARRNHIHHTGIGGSTGEGMYVGCHEGDCAVSDSLIEGNWIHHTRAAEQGDGIEIKKGSHSNIVRDNVVHDTKYPCIILYGTQGNPPNLVEGNVMWGCDDAGIQVAADAVIRNNIIFATTGGGLTSQDHAGVTPRNLQIIHNTIVSGSPCLRLSSWNNKPGMVLANNAIYCTSGSFAVSGLTGVTVTGNVVVPASNPLPASGYTLGRSAALDLVNPGGLNAYPTADSRVIDAGAAAFVTPADFNWTERTGPADAGAYTWTGPSNPGWAVTSGFKALPSGDSLPPGIPSNVRVR